MGLVIELHFEFNLVKIRLRARYRAPQGKIVRGKMVQLY